MPAPMRTPDAARPAALAVLPLFALHEALWIVHGLRTGRLLLEDPAAGAVLRLDGAVFGLAYAATSVALLAIHARLAGRERVLGRAGAVLAGVALATTLVAAASVVATASPVPFAFPVATVSVFLSALTLGAAGLRSGALPRSAGRALVAFGLGTMPLALALPVLLRGLLPEYALYEAHFLVSGALWTIAGVTLGRTGTVPGRARSAALTP